jgi:hypothetical protein
MRAVRREMAVNRFTGLAGLAFLTLALAACEREQARYFKTHVNTVSQEAVVRRFGPPHRAHELRTGDTVVV